MARDDEDRDSPYDEAVRWFGRSRLGKREPATQESLMQWQENPAHAAQYARVVRVWQDLGNLDQLPEGRAMLDEVAAFVDAPKAGEGRIARIRVWASTHRFALAASVLIAAILIATHALSPVRYVTETGEIRALSLPDGSRVTLGGRSRMELRFSDGERRVRLAGGEAFFEVHKDAARPFIVDAGEAWVRVLGTKFDVRRTPDHVNVAVLEGAVEVVPPLPGTAQQADASGTDGRYIPAGQQLSTGKSMTNARLQPTSSSAPPGAWRSGRLSYDGARLADVIADVNRYYPEGVALSSESLGELSVTTAFNVDQIDLMLSSLSRALPLSVHRERDGRVLLEPRPD